MNHSMIAFVKRFASDLCLRFVVIIALLGAGACLAAPGDIDTGFGDGGSILEEGQLLTMSDGRLVIGRPIADGFEVVAYEPTGRQRDSTFGTAGRTFISLPGNANLTGPAARTANGKLLFSGERTVTGGSKVPQILRVTANGSPDPAFGSKSDGIVELPDMQHIVALVGLQDDRTLVLEWRGECVGDDIGGWSCNGPLAVWRLLANGSVDKSFGNSGAAVIPESDSAGYPPSVFGVRADGSILVGDNTNVPMLAVLTPAGAIDTSFDAATAKGSEAWWKRGVILPDGGLLLVGVADPDNGGSPEEAWDTQILKLRTDGRLDTSFGGGSGVVTLNLSAVVSARTDLVERIAGISLSPDGSQLYLETLIDQPSWRDEFFCLGLARMNVSGVLDATFGQQGVTCVMRGAPYPIDNYRLAVQASGEPLLVLSSDRSPPSFPTAIYRLRPDNVPSPGVISMHGVTSVQEEAGTLSIKVARTAGKSGAVSVMYSTEAGSALAGDDFVAASGRLDWADGDDTERTINITIRNDAVREQTEAFRLNVTSTAGGPLLLGSSLTIDVYDNDPVASSPQTTASDASTSNGGSVGGGGAIQLSTLLFLAGLYMLVRGNRQRKVTSAASAGSTGRR